MKKDKMSSSNPAKDQDPKGGHLIPDNILKKIAGITPTFPNDSDDLESNSSTENEKKHPHYDKEVAKLLGGRDLCDREGRLPTIEEVYKVDPSCQESYFLPNNKRGVPSQQKPLIESVPGHCESSRVLPPDEVRKIYDGRRAKV